MSGSYLNNMTTNATQSYIPDVFPKHADGFIKGIYVIVTMLGIFGNCIVLILILTKRVEQTTFSILLANLSVADLIADISLYPYVFIDLRGFDVSEQQGRVLCNFTIGLTMFFTCTAVSLLTLTTISINRYICINHPLRFEWQQSKQCVLYFIPFTWVTSILVLTPNYISFVYKKKLGICRRQWPTEINGLLYTIFTSFFGLFVPIIVLLLTFIVTLKNLKTKVYHSSSQPTVDNSRRKTIRLLGWLIVVFCSCWTPFFIYWCLSRAASIFDQGNNGDYQRMRVIRVTILIAAMNTAIDPLIYALLSGQYRAALRGLVRRAATVAPNNTTATVASFSKSKRDRYLASSEKSSFSTKAIDEEYRDRMKPKSSIVIESFRIARYSSGKA